MVTTRIAELEARVQANPDDDDAWYALGMALYEDSEWTRAHECFNNAEVASINKVGDRYQGQGNNVKAQAYYQKAQKIQNKPFKLAPGGSDWMQNFLILTGVFAMIFAIPAIILWPSIGSLILLIGLLLDLLVFMIVLPIAISKHIGSKKRSPEEFQIKIQYYERQIELISENSGLPENVKFLQIAKFKQKRARAAQEIVRCEYTESVTSAK